MTTNLDTEASEDLLTEASDELITETDAAVDTSTADFPALRVEWLPSVGPDTSDGAWEDLTLYLAEGSTIRGRNYELDRFETGSASLTLKTTTRLFDPDNSAGAYYGQLKPMRQVRIVATWLSVDYPIWRGYVTDWGQTTPDDVMFVTTVQCEDGFARLAQMVMDFSAYSERVEGSAPNVWYRFDDTQSLIDSSGNDRHGYWTGTAILGSGPVVGDSSMCAEFDGNFAGRGFHSVNMSVVNYSIEFWFKTAQTDQVFLQINGNGLVHAIYMVAGKIRVYNSGTSFYDETDDTFSDDEWHHFVFVPSTGIYIDGAAVSTTTAGPGFPSFIGTMLNGQMIIGGAPTGSNAVTGSFDELAIYSSLLTPAEVAAHYVAGTTPLFGDQSGVRIGRVLDAIGWPSDLRDIADGVAVLGSFTQQNSDALSYLQQIADTEVGLLYMDAEGKVVFRDRHYLYTNSRATDVQATFGDGQSGEALVYMDLDPPREEGLIRNPVTASREGGVTVVARDTSGIDEYGERNWNAPSSLDSTDNVIRDRAYFLLARFKDETTRIAGSRFAPRSNVALWPVLLGLEFGDRTAWKRKPLNLNSQNTYTQHVERIAHQFRPLWWETALTGSPVDTTTWAVFDEFLFDEAVFGY